MNHRTVFTAVALALLIAGCSDGTAPNQPASAGTSLASSEGRSLQLTKECSQYTGRAGDHCTIIKSNVKLIPAGSTVTYLVAADLEHLTFDGAVVLQTTPGNAAYGHCRLTDLIKAIGNCEFSGGTGRLSGFSASVVVSGDPDPLLAHWKGEYSLGS
jgi:hypothetical protein